METGTLQSTPTAFQRLKAQCASNPLNIAVQSEDVSITYRELDDMTTRLGSYLRHRSVNQNDSVLVILPRGMEMALTAIGVSRHAICVPLNPEITAIELNRLLGTISPKLVLAYTALLPIIAACPNLPEGIPVEEIVLDDSTNSWQFQGDSPPPEAIDESFPEPQSTSFLLLTSGSTSSPKLVPLSHENIAFSARNLITSLKLKKSDRCLNTMTMFHVGGLLDLLIAPLMNGSTVICPNQTGAPAFFEHMQKYRPTWFQCVPTVLIDIVNYANQENIAASRHSELRFIRSVSAPLSREWSAKAETLFGVPVIEIYGMTETAGVITSNPLPPDRRIPHSVGKAVEGIGIQVIDGQNNPVPTNRLGEVIVSGPSVFSGYFDHEASNREIFIGKWFRTGDIGMMDDEGHLFLKGRVKEIINRGGEKIAPREIDEVLCSHPEIADAAAFSIAHPTLGEDVAAAVVLNPGIKLDEKALRKYLSQHLTRFKQPREILEVDRLPRNSGGKLQRHLLTANYSENSRSTPTVIDAPTSDLEIVVAQLWKKTLDLREVSLHDNFFDLGGDSLRATLFIAQLEENLGGRIDPKVIYEFPILSNFTRQLESNLRYKPSQSSAIREELYAELQRLMAAWPGSRLNDQALIVGHNVVGSKTPIFWCTNSLNHFVEQVKHFDADQPIYGMVTLMESKLRSVENNARAASIYADEILQIKPHQEIVIGGWCEGVKIMIDTANLVREAGIPVKLLFMQDNFIPKLYNGPVAFFYSHYATQRFRAQYWDPDFGIGKYYTGGYLNFDYDIDHTDCYENPSTIKAFAGELNTVLRQMDKSNGFPPSKPDTTPYQHLLPADYRANVKINRPPLFMQWDDAHLMEVEVENKSDTIWQPSSESGIILMFRWLNYKYLQLEKDRVLLTKSVAPGEKITLPVKIQSPKGQSSAMVLFLEIDLVDDGVARFSSHASKAVRFPTLSSTLMLYPVFLFSEVNNFRWIEKVIWYRNLNAQSLPILFTNLSIRTIRKLRDLTYKYTQ